MANILKQATTQTATEITEKRLVIVYIDDATNEKKQVISNYEDLTTEEKATFDAFTALSASKMV